MDKYIYAGLSLQNKRATNMDSLLMTERLLNGKRVLLAAVCDGVGSLADGGEASAGAVRLLNEWFTDLSEGGHLGLRLRDAISEINKRLTEEALINGFDTGSTMSSLLLSDGSFYIVNIGDSRVYSIENKTAEVLTKDDVTPLGELTSVIGRTEQSVMFYSEGRIDEKTFIVCSDGFYKRLDFDYLIKKIRYKSKKDMIKSIKHLTEHVIKLGEKDNITVIFIRSEK